LTVVACAGPAFRTPEDAEAPHGSGSSVLSSAGNATQQVDQAGGVNAHRSPAATTASGLPASLASRAETSEDAAIVERIHAALRAEQTLSAETRVEVVSRGGHVLLSGRVRSDAERTTIENAVQAVAGVVRIESRLTVAER
jgi:osmotically-inducible protein OsmY